MKVPYDHPSRKYDYPAWVKRGLIADMIVYMCSEQKFKLQRLPLPVREFVKLNPPDRAHEFQVKLLEQAGTMPLDTLALWVDNMPGGLTRAQMRAILKQRLTERTP